MWITSAYASYVLLLLRSHSRRVPLAPLVPAQVGQARDALLGLAPALGGNGALHACWHRGGAHMPNFTKGFWSCFTPRVNIWACGQCKGKHAAYVQVSKIRAAHRRSTIGAATLRRIV